MISEDAVVTGHERREGGYYLLSLRSPRIAPQVRPGQFLHVRLPSPEDAILRRPFSIFQTDGDTVRILYKPVGRGTHSMTALQPGDPLSVIGPLGNGFPAPAPDTVPVLIAGGYGMAALYLLAAGAPRAGVAFFGGASSPDILCVPEFEALGWSVRIATEDGTRGERGLVTAPLDAWLAAPDRPPAIELFACGPNGMLKAVAARAAAVGARAWISIDRGMGCGVGACLTCVQRIRALDGTVAWARVCKDGPVFEGRTVVWEDEA
jgi:dihydroorotate dehydrogenase electron transfer subunit